MPNNNPFENIKKFNYQGTEFWYARDLQKVLEYQTWDKFKKVIDKAITACKQSKIEITNHFSQLGKMVSIGSGAERKVEDFALSRYACYLIIQNADPSKEIIAIGQTYFAVQTRRQELKELADKSENRKRLLLREEIRKHNKKLANAARNAGVIKPLDYAIFQDHGYKGLYGGLSQKAIHKKKKLGKNQKIMKLPTLKCGVSYSSNSV